MVDEEGSWNPRQYRYGDSAELYLALETETKARISASIEIQALGDKIDFTEIWSFVPFPFWVDLDCVESKS